MANEGYNDYIPELMSKLYQSTEYGDVTFIFKSENHTQKVSANKSILTAGSPVFHAMFFGPIKEEGDVEIFDATPEAFMEFLQFFYLNKIKLTMENMEEVAALADKYDMTEFIDKYAEQFVGILHIANVCWGYQLAIITKNGKLKEYCEKRIIDYPNDIFESESFLHCNRNVLKEILLLDGLVCGECEIFKACLAWAKHACSENGLNESDPKLLKQPLGECFYLIRFSTIPSDDFIKNTLPYEKMFTRDELSDVLYKSAASKFNLKPRWYPEWDDNNKLVCEQPSSTSNYYIQNPETIWFSVDGILLFGGFDFWDIKHSDSTEIVLDFDVIISEIPSKSFKEPMKAKVIFQTRKKITTSGGIKVVDRVNFDSPIIVRPNKMYEIRVVSSVNISGYFVQSSKWPGKITLGKKASDVSIIFNRDPSKILCNGLVSKLYFNKWVRGPLHQFPILEIC